MSLANSRLKQSRKPKITPLHGGRLRVERWFKIYHENDSFASKLAAKLLGGFGLLDGTTAGDFGKVSRPDAAFPDCRLISEEIEEFFSKDGKSWHQLTQVYETLTAIWALEEADVIETGASGLDELTRSQVAMPGTALPTLTVGTTTLVFDAGTEDEVTFYLASKDDKSDERRGKVITKWEVPGLLSESEPIAGQDGLRQKSVTWRGTLGTAPADYLFAGKVTQNPAGWPTITAQYYNGDDLLNRVAIYHKTVSFTLPGIVDTKSNPISGSVFTNKQLAIKPPTPTTVPATILVSYHQDTLKFDSASGTFVAGETITGSSTGASAAISANGVSGGELKLESVEGLFADNETLTGGTSGATAQADGLMNALTLPANFYQPTSGVNVEMEGIGLYYRPFASSSNYTNHIKAPGSTTTGSDSLNLIQGNRLYEGTTGYITVTGTEVDPAGTTKTMSISAPPVFRLGEVQWYRKEVVIYTIPARA